jgi:hypothetical protein
MRKQADAEKSTPANPPDGQLDLIERIGSFDDD